MIAKDLMPWMFVKRTATWTPYVKIRSERLSSEPARSSPSEDSWERTGRRPGRKPPRG